MNADAMALAAILDSKDEEHQKRKEAEEARLVVAKRYEDFRELEHQKLQDVRGYLHQQYDSTDLNGMLSDINFRYAMNREKAMQWEHCFEDFKEAGHTPPTNPWRIILRVMYRDNVALFVDHMVEKFNDGK